MSASQHRGNDNDSGGGSASSDQDGECLNVPVVVATQDSNLHHSTNINTIIGSSYSPRREHSVQRTPSLSSGDDDTAFDEYINCEDKPRRATGRRGHNVHDLGIGNIAVERSQEQQQQYAQQRCGTAPSRSIASNPLSPPSRDLASSPNQRAPHHHHHYQDDHTLQGRRLISIVSPHESSRPHASEIVTRNDTATTHLLDLPPRMHSSNHTTTTTPPHTTAAHTPPSVASSSSVTTDGVAHRHRTGILVQQQTSQSSTTIPTPPAVTSSQSSHLVLAEQLSSRHNTPDAFLPHPSFTLPGAQGGSTATGSNSTTTSTANSMCHHHEGGGGVGAVLDDEHGSYSDGANSSLHNSRSASTTANITSTTGGRDHHRPPYLDHRHYQPTHDYPTSGSGSVLASPTLPHQQSVPIFRSTSTPNRPYLQPISNSTGAVHQQYRPSGSSPRAMALSIPPPPPPPFAEFYNSSNSNSTPMNTSQGAAPQEGAGGSGSNYRKAMMTASVSVTGGVPKYSSAHTTFSRAGTTTSDIGRFVNSSSITSFTGWGVEDGANTPTHNRPFSSPTRQPPPQGSAFLNNNSFSIQAVSGFMSLLGPGSQAACRSSCKLFAKVFVSLVNGKQVPVVAHDDTVQHLIATGGMSTGTPSIPTAPVAGGSGIGKRGVHQLNASVLSGGSSSVYERLGSSMVLSTTGAMAGDVFNNNTNSPSLSHTARSGPQVLSSPNLRRTPSMYHEVPSSLLLAPIGHHHHHHHHHQHQQIGALGGWYDQDEDDPTRNHLGTSWSPETSPVRNQQFNATHSSSISGSLGRSHGHMPLPLSSNACAQLQTVQTAAANVAGTPSSSRRLLGSPISDSLSEGNALTSPLSGKDIPARSLHRRGRGNGNRQLSTQSPPPHQVLSIGGALQVFSEDQEGDDGSDSEVNSPTKDCGAGVYSSSATRMMFPTLQSIHTQHCADMDSSNYQPPPSPRGATHNESSMHLTVHPAPAATPSAAQNVDPQHSSILIGSNDRLFDTNIPNTTQSSEVQQSSPLLNPTNRFHSSVGGHAGGGGSVSPCGSTTATTLLPVAFGAGVTGGTNQSSSAYELCNISADQLDTTHIPRCVDVDEDDSTELFVRVPRHRLGGRAGGSSGGSGIMSPNGSFRPTYSSGHLNQNSDLDDSLSLSCGRLNTSGSGLFTTNHHNHHNFSTSSLSRSPALSSTRFGSGTGAGGGDYTNNNNYNSSSISNNNRMVMSPTPTTATTPSGALLTRCRSIKDIGNNLSFSGSIHSSIARSARGATLGSALRWAPVSLLSPHLGDLFIIVNVEAAANSIIDFPNVEAMFIDPSTSKMTTTPPSHATPIHSIRILDEFCANISMKSIEVTGCAKLVSIGRGFLAGVNATSIRYGPLPRLKEVGDEWMFLCPYVEHIGFSGDCESLKRVGDSWLAECFSIVKVDLSACHEVEFVGSNWLARCQLLSSIKFSTFHNLVEVGDRWLSSCQSLKSASFDGLASLRRVGSGWLYAGTTLTSVAFSGLLALREVGDTWLADCLQLRVVSFNGMSSLHTVGAYWLARCAVLQHVSLLGVIKLSVVGPGWMGSTFSPKVVCGNNNRGHVSALVKVSFLRARGGGPASKEAVASEAPDPRLLLANHTSTNNLPTSPHRRRTK